jgi:hypothetical protein
MYASFFLIHFVFQFKFPNQSLLISFPAHKNILYSQRWGGVLAPDTILLTRLRPRWWLRFATYRVPSHKILLVQRPQACHLCRDPPQALPRCSGCLPQCKGCPTITHSSYEAHQGTTHTLPWPTHRMELKVCDACSLSLNVCLVFISHLSFNWVLQDPCTRGKEFGFHMLFLRSCRKMVLSAEYDFTKLKDELQLCALILSYSPKNESTWSHRYTPSCTCEASFLVDLFLSDNSYLFRTEFYIIKSKTA